MASSIVNFSMIFLYVITAVTSEENTIKVFDSELEISKECLDLKDTSIRKLFYCSEKPPSYPQEDFDAYVDKLRISLPEQPEEILMPNDHFTRDDACGEEEHRNCCTESKIEQPYIVHSMDKMKVVIQSKLFQQTIRTVRCANEGTECFSDFGLKDFGLKTQCKTDYGITKLFVYNSETKKIETVPVTFPVSCSCHFSKDVTNTK